MSLFSTLPIYFAFILFRHHFPKWCLTPFIATKKTGSRRSPLNRLID